MSSASKQKTSGKTHKDELKRLRKRLHSTLKSQWKLPHDAPPADIDRFEEKIKKLQDQIHNLLKSAPWLVKGKGGRG